MKRFRKFYWKRKSDIKQQTMFDDPELLTNNLRRNTAPERKKVMEAEIMLKTRANWTDDYLKLLEDGWKWEKAAYIAWCKRAEEVKGA